MRAALRKVLFFGLAVAYCWASWSQGISVSSFKELKRDLSARVNPILNDNDETCALIKIVTAEKNFSFEPDALGICQIDDSPVSEIHMYVAPGSRRLTIMHPDFGILRNYEYPVLIESACTYEMVLQTTSPLYSKYKENYVIFHVLPVNAEVRIDGNLVENKAGSPSQMLAVGKHSYTVSDSLYHPQKGTFEITPGDFTELNVELQPNFGYLEVITEPELEASIQINGEERGVTPFFSGRIKCGKYSVRVNHELYKPFEKKITVTNDTFRLRADLVSNFGYVSLYCHDRFASLRLDGKELSDGVWSGYLPAGEHIVIASRPLHHSFTTSFTLEAGDSLSVAVEPPIPQQGTICISSVPDGAEVYLDGELKGKTPTTIENVPIGTYRLSLKKRDYPISTQYIKALDGDTLRVDVSFSEGRQLNIKNVHQAASLFVDDEYIGLGNQKIKLSDGQHLLSARYVNLVYSDTISIWKGMSRKISIQGDSALLQLKEMEKRHADSVRRNTPKRPFFTLNGALSPQMQWSFGLRFGSVKKWGWNISLMTFIHFQAYTALSTQPYDLFTFDEKKDTRVSATVGVVWHPTRHLLLFANGGYGFRGVAYHSTQTDEYYLYKPNTFHGFEGQLGLAGAFGSVLLSVEAATINFKYVELKVGFGFIRK